MALVLADRVLETTTTTGSGTITLAGAEPGYQSFSAVGNGNQTYYTITADTVWEVGIGTYTASGTTLSRDTVLSSSASGAKVTLPSGVKKVFVTYPSEKSVNLDVSGNISLSSAVISGVGYPSANSDAATKLYVDTLAAEGISYHTPVKYEVPDTTGNLNATYNNGTAGVSATLTNAGTLGPFVPDGVTASISDRILIYNQTNAVQNGVYVVTTVGTGASSWVLTRAADANTYGVKSPTALGTGDAFYVTSGNTGAGETYVCNTPGTIVFGSTNITFVQVSAAQVYQAGTGISLTNTTISLVSPVVVATGGTGLTSTPTNGQLLIGNGSGYTLSTLTAGSGVSITNSAGSITLTATGTGGTVVAVTASAPLASTGGVSPNISIANTTGTGSVVLDQGATISSATITAGVSAAITTITGSSANITTVTGTTAGFSSAAITQLSGTSAGITTVSGTTTTFSSGTITQFGATSATITTLSGTSVTYPNANFTSASITNLALTSLTLANLSITSANVTTLTGTNLTYTSGTVTNLNSTSANITTLTGTTFGTTAATNLRGLSAQITTATVTSADITTLTGTTFGTTATTQLRGASGAITTLSGTTATFTSATVTNLALTSLTITSLSITNLAASSATITTGNLAFTGTAQRITGDMSSSPFSSRLMFQTSTTNGSTDVGIIPNGSGAFGTIRVFGSSDPTNSQWGTMFCNGGTEVRLTSSYTGTPSSGTYLPMTFYTGGSERMRLDTSGNLLLGTASNATGITTRFLTKSGSAYAASAVFESDGSAANWARTDWKNANIATPGIIYIDQGGEFAIRNDGNYPLSFYTNGANQRMTITGAGNVGIGTASPLARLDLGTSTGQKLLTYGSGNVRYGLSVETSEWRAFAPTGAVLTFGNMSTSDGATFTERMRLDTSGNLGIGTASPSTKLHVFNGAITTQQFGAASLVDFYCAEGTSASPTALISSRQFGALRGYGYDGSSYILASSIDMQAESAWSVGTTPSYLRFRTTATGGGITERMRIDSSGNVGIGTTSPGTKLQVAGGVSAEQVQGRYFGFGTAGFSLDGTTVNDYGITYTTISSTFNTVLAGYSNIKFATNQTERMRIDSSGNVGIGTSSPNAKLDVLTTASTRLLFTERSTGGNVIDSVNGGNSAYTQFLLNGSTLIFATGATERMRIDSSGNVGIGTASPVSKLSVGGNPPLSGVLAGVSAANSISLALSDNTNNSLYVKHVASGAATFGTDSGGQLAFATNGFTERMRIDASGNVGIGTASPSSKLEVNGGAISVKNSGGGEGGEILLYNPDNSTVGMVLDVSSANVGRIFSTNNSFSLQLGQLSGTGGVITAYTAGSERLRIDSSGNVGIGTSSPGTKLTVAASGEAGARFLGNGLSSAGLFVGYNSAAYVYNDSNTDMIFGTNAAERMRLTAAGYVGIGRTPSVTLDVNGPIYSRYTATWGAAALYMPGGYSQFGKDNGHRTDIVNTGGLDANNPFWIGYQWCPPDVITNSSAQNSFPRTSFYFNYSTVTNPSNMTWNMYTGNNNGIPISWSIGTESAGTFNIVTSGNARFTVGASGQFGIAGNYGTSGQVFTSNGASSAPSWQTISGIPTNNVTSSTSISATAGNHYILRSSTTATVTLPSSPAAGDLVWVTVSNGLTTNVIARNGKPIQGIAEDMTLNSKYAAVQLRYSDATMGWIFC